MASITCIERYQRRPDVVSREGTDDPLPTIGCPDRHPVACRHAQIQQGGTHVSHELPRVAKGERHLAVDQIRPVLPAIGSQIQ